MKISNREAILLAALAVFAIVYAFVQFALPSQLSANRDLRQQLAAVRSQQDELDRYVQDEPALLAQLAGQQQEIAAISDKYFPDLMLEHMLLLIDELRALSGTPSSGISVAPPAAESVFQRSSATPPPELMFPLKELVRQLTGESAEVPALGPNPIVSPEVYHISTSLQVQGSFDRVIAFLTEVQNYDRKILVSDLSLSGSSSSVSATMTAHIYGIPKPFVYDEEYLSWDWPGPYERSNPFRP